MIRIANFCFVIGSIVDVILSYIYLNEKESLSSMERSDMLKQGELSSAILWTIAGIGYMCVTCIGGKDSIKTSIEETSSSDGTTTNLSQSATMA